MLITQSNQKSYVTNEYPLRTGALSVYPYSSSLEARYVFKTSFEEEVRGAIREGNTLLVPRESVPYAQPPNDFRVSYPITAIDCKFEPRYKGTPYDQKVLSDRSVAYLKSGINHIFEAATGYGKTIAGSYIATQLGQPTMIIVNKEDLIDQWKEALIKVLGISPQMIGRVQQNTCEWEGKLFVIGMVHSLIIPNRYPQEMYDRQGFVIYDEVHQMATECFIRSCHLFRAKYRLGFSATPTRKDGKTKLLNWHIGPTLIKGNVVAMKPKIIVRQTGWSIPARRKLVGTGYVYEKIPHSPGRMMLVNKAMAQSDLRNLEIVNFVLQTYKAGRNCLVMSDLKEEHLNRLFQMLTSKGIPGNDIGYYVGGMSKLSLELSKVKRVVLGCVTPDTEILTFDSGWKKYNKLHIGEPVATYNLERKVIEYQPLDGVHTYEYEGDLCHLYRRKSCDIMMTWNHRNIVNTGVGVQKILRADELHVTDSMKLFAPMEYPEWGSIGVDMAAMMGWVIAEGTYTDGGDTNYPSRGVKLHQNEGPNAVEIRRLLHALEFDFTEYPANSSGQVIWRIKSSGGAEKIRALSDDKKLNRHLISLPLEEAWALFNALINGDGNRRPNGKPSQFIQKDRKTVDWFTILAMRLGMKPKISRVSDGKGNWIYRVYLEGHSQVYLGNAETLRIPVPYKGIVWCPTTPNGTWVARRNGHVFITGNTYKMCSTGTNVPRWDSLVMATPRADVKQSIGRVLREQEGKKQPVILDLVDEDSIFQNFHLSRVKQYYSVGAEIVKV